MAYVKLNCLRNNFDDKLESILFHDMKNALFIIKNCNSIQVKLKQSAIQRLRKSLIKIDILLSILKNNYHENSFQYYSIQTFYRELENFVLLFFDSKNITIHSEIQSSCVIKLDRQLILLKSLLLFIYKIYKNKVTVNFKENIVILCCDTNMTFSRNEMKNEIEKNLYFIESRKLTEKLNYKLIPFYCEEELQLKFKLIF